MISQNIVTKNVFSCTMLILSIGTALSQTPNDYVYVVSYSQNQVEQYRQNPQSGQLILVDKTATVNNPYALAVDSDHKFLYVISQNSNVISSYEINANTGNLSYKSKIKTQTRPSNLIIVRQRDGEELNQYLYVSNFMSNTISMYKITPGGKLSALVPSEIRTGIGPRGLAFDARGNRLLVTDLQSNDVFTYKIAKNGLLTFNSKTYIPAGNQPWSIQIANFGNNVYITDQLNNRINMFSINPDEANNQLQPLYPSQVQTGNYPFDLIFDPSQTYAYVTNLQSNCLSAYKLQADGQLKLLKLEAIKTGLAPRNAIFDPSGQFLYVLNQLENSISMYHFNLNDGNLTPLEPAKTLTGLNPYQMVFVANSKLTQTDSGL